MKTEFIETELLDTETNLEHYNSICNKILDYIMSFNSDDPLIQQNYNLKREHTNRVVGYSEVIARSLKLEKEDEMIVQLIALLHDIGRFEQMTQYETFDDNESRDHAELGIEIIKEKNWISHLPDYIQDYIISAISNHNKLDMLKNENEKVSLFSKIIRDADKIDILDLTIKEYSKPAKNRNEKLTLGLAEKPHISKSVVKSVVNGKSADKKQLKTVNDFKLMQISWVYDLNYRKSFSIINKMQFLKQLFDSLPKTDDVFEAYRKAKIHIENQLI